MIKFKSAEYYKGANALKVFFIISNFAINTFDEQAKEEVHSAVSTIFPDINVTVEYLKTHTDAETVKNKIVEYFNSHHQYALKTIPEEAYHIDVQDSSSFVDVVIDMGSALYKMFEVKGEAEKLQDYLNRNFNYEVSVKFNEVKTIISQKQYESAIAPKISKTTFIPVRTESSKTIYPVGQGMNINGYAKYISEINEPATNMIICGKISSFAEKEYTNKRFDSTLPPSDKNPEKLPLFRWTLNDMTGTIDCIVFPSIKSAPQLRVIKNGDEVVCVGSVDRNNFGGLSFKVNSIAYAEIDYSVIKQEKSLPEPKHYVYLKPEPYSEVEQGSLIDCDLTVPSLLRNNDFVVFDLETTSLNTQEAMIIEIAGIKIRNGKIIEIMHSFVNPRMRIPADTTKLTGITDADVAAAPTFDLIAGDFFKFTRGASLVAHNINYDFPILNRLSKESGYIYKNDLYDTLALAQQYFPNAKMYNLGALTKLLDIELVNAHRAAADALATAKLFKIIAAKMDEAKR
ncbi:MAG: hypothetical protein GX891_04895 [Clostridiales bacterium]|nr:hypothetical protein [Clostridiales bacterium]